MTPTTLEQHGFTLLDRLEHLELVPFIQQYLKKRTRSAVWYWVLNFALLCSVVGWLIGQRAHLGGALGQVSNGILLTLVLVPLHEYMHALAYRWAGASQVSYDVQWRKFIFMAVADQFVASRRAFQVVALAPFVVISAGLLAGLFLTPWTGVALGALLMHTACCSGDFGLLSYFDAHSELEVVTYDDRAGKVSYFFARQPQVGDDTP